MLYSKRTLLSIRSVATLFLLLATQLTFGSQSDYGVRADLPAGGELSVINPRGAINVEVWGEKHVSVMAAVKGEKPKGAPVAIKRTDELLTVSVSPLEIGMLTRVDLTLRIPERSRATIVADTGQVIVRGVPAELNVQTGYGDIRAEFPSSADVDIDAQSPAAAVQNKIPSLVKAGGEPNRVQISLGGGGKPARLFSKRGRITLISYSTAASSPSTEEPRTGPTLIGSDVSRPAAGTPSTPLTSPEEIEEGDVVRVDTELVTMNVSVIDRGTNRGLTGLGEKDFKLFEDGSPQEIAHFESANAPFNLILLMDLSISTKEKIGLIRDAALRFVNAARPADRIGIITFAKTQIVVSPLTDDRVALRRRIGEITEPRGSTKVYDSLAFAMEEILKGAKDSRRNAIVMMSDGLDSTMPNVTGEGSTLEYKEVLSRVREFDGVLYTLWLDTTYEPLSVLDIQEDTFDTAYEHMEELAEAGGGLFYEVAKLEDLAGAYERVIADLGTVYSLSYRPTKKERDGKWRAIRVTLTRADAVARGKRGYYAN